MVANFITGIRILCALSLVFCPTFSVWFFVPYIAGGISDMLDGFIARRLGTATKLGAQLDTIADVAFAAVVIIKVLSAVSVPTWLWIWIICVTVIKGISAFMGFVFYKRFTSEHTVLNKLCGMLLFALPLYIGFLPRQAFAIVMIFHCCVATVAAIQENYYIRTGKIIF